MYISRFVRILEYWFKIRDTDNIVLQTMSNVAYNDCNNGKKNWESNVKRMLNEYGFSHVWDFPSSVNFNVFIKIFKQRVIDCFFFYKAGVQAKKIVAFYIYIISLKQVLDMNNI